VLLGPVVGEQSATDIFSLRTRPAMASTIADWLLDRVNGRCSREDFRYVTAEGLVEVVEQQTHPRYAEANTARVHRERVHREVEAKV
jgi:hypothetical protein